MGVLTANVIARYVLATGGFDWAEEVPEQVFPWFIMAGVALAVQHGGHVAVEWLLGKLGRGGNRIVLLAGQVLVIGAYAFLCWQALVVADIVAIERSPALGLPKTYGYWAIAAGCVLVALSTARRSPSGSPSSAPRRCPGPARRRCRHEPRPDPRLRGAHGGGRPGRARPRHRLRHRAALGRATCRCCSSCSRCSSRRSPSRCWRCRSSSSPARSSWRGELGQELLRFSGELMQRVRGGALSTTVVGSVVFGGVSGSAVANASALGSVLIPWQKRQGYPGRALRGQQRDLGGDRYPDPALDPDDPLRGRQRGQHRRPVHGRGGARHPRWRLGFIGVCWWNARRLNLSTEAPPLDMRKVARLALLAIPALILPVLILVALRFGFATPTEIAVMAVLYALAASLFIYRDMSWRRFHKAMIDAGIATGIVMMVIMGSAAASWILTYDQVPQRFAEWVSTTLREPWLVILAMNVIMLAIGGPLDLAPAILLLAPIFVPLAQQIGLDPLQLGLMMVLNLGIGLYTPPVGTTLFISTTIAGSTMVGDDQGALAVLLRSDRAAACDQLHPGADRSVLIQSLAGSTEVAAAGGEGRAAFRLRRSLAVVQGRLRLGLRGSRRAC